MSRAARTLQTLPANEVKAYLKRILEDDVYRREQLGTVTTKLGEVVPFAPWETQARFFRLRQRVNWVIKIRQQGFTVGSFVDYLGRMVTRKNYRIRIYNQSDKLNPELFRTAHQMLGNIPVPIGGKTDTSTRSEIVFSRTGSSISITTAGQTEKQSLSAGRGVPSNCVHYTEAGYIEHLESLLGGTLGSLAPDGMVTLESTSSGPKGYFSRRFIDVMARGDQVEPNVWLLGDHAAFFFGLIEHPEYVLPVNGAVTAMDDEEELLFSLGAKPGTILFRRMKLRDFGGDIESSSAVPPVLRFKREYPATAQQALEEAQGAYFDGSRLNLMKATSEASMPKPEGVRVGFLSDGVTAPMLVSPPVKGFVTIWLPPVGGWGGRYLVFADVGEGLETSDFDVIYCYDMVLRAVVAASRGRYGAKLTARIALDMARHYHDATLSWDATGCGAELRPYLLGYRKTWSDRKDAKDNETGLKWSAPKKHIACAALKHWIDERQLTILHKEFYEEAAEFAYGEDSTPSAPVGRKDDCVMAMAGVAYIASQLGAPNKKEKLERALAGRFEGQQEKLGTWD